MWNAGRLVAVSCLMLSAACGGSQKPNPLPPEEPMDKNGTSADATPATTAASTGSDPSGADPSAGLSSADPTAAPATPPPDTTAAADPKGKGKGGKGKGKGTAAKGELSASECSQLSDKGVDLLVASMGMSDPAMVAQIKAQAAGDPNFAGMQTECVKSTTRAQYKCGMSAKSKDAWEACLK